MRIYNSYTRTKEEFVPIKEGEVSMYVCGVTPYDYAHIGNARPAIIFDTLYRYLKACGNKVTYARNFTDVDDKIIKRSEESYGSATPENCVKLTEKFISIYHADMAKLNVLGEADDEGIMEPRVTNHMTDIVGIIVQLLDNGFAYIGESGDVLYDTTKFETYGKLSGKNLDELIAGARVEISTDKKNPTDFVLWKSAKKGEPSWDFDSKYPSVNAGRPGWHIECSAMSGKLLGETFDIHGGGEDLQFPHHECEIAQSKGAHGGDFARYWMHNAFINVDGEKMAKSVGNFRRIHDILDVYSGGAVRYWMLSTHYRKPVDLTDTALESAEKAVSKMENTLVRAEKMGADPKELILPIDFIEAMDDDLNTAAALAVLNESVTLLNKAIAAENVEKATVFLQQVLGMDGVLGIFSQAEALEGEDDAEIDALVEARNAAKSEKNWAEADRIRDELTGRGVVLEDGKSGTSWRRK